MKDEEKHWDAIAKNYEEEVLDVFKYNRDGKLQDYIHQYADKKYHATDFGCGIGNGFEHLSSSFKEILAVDISQKCLDIAHLRNFPNITFQQVDLTADDVSLPKTDFAICCNVAILPDAEQNRIIIENVYKTLRKDGAAIFVIPSVESALFSAWRMIDWYNREGIATEDIPTDELDHFKSPQHLYQGLIKIDGVTTKHYLQSEIQVLFSNAGFSIDSIDQVEYDWKTEFDSPPSWMKQPFPWDWLVVCHKP